MNEKVTLISALCIAISCIAAALVWVVKQWHTDKNKHITDKGADRDILINLIKDNTKATTEMVAAIKENTKATDLTAQMLEATRKPLKKKNKGK